MFSVSAILFDLDGTLVDLCGVHRSAFRRALADSPDAPRPRWSPTERGYWFIRGPGEDPVFESELEALPTKEKLRKLGVVGELAAQVSEAKQRYTVSEENLNRVEPNPELVAMLCRLQTLRPARDRVRLGCVTNSVRQTAQVFLDRAGLLPYMDTVVTNEDCKAPKPAPDPYLAALDRLGLSKAPERVLVLEDHPKGMASAQAAGCYVIPTTCETITYLGPFLSRVLSA